MAAVLNICRKYGALDPIFGQEQYAQIPTAVIGIVMKFFPDSHFDSDRSCRRLYTHCGTITSGGRNDRSA